MENLKDQQIESQKETIQSLERKIESLENELQKFLDPDSGTISPRFTPSKHGEPALLEQIATLQKQLDKCLVKDQPVLILTRYIRNTLATACAAPFMPLWESYEDGGRFFHSKHSLWERLQTELLGDNLKDYWTHKAFKQASRYVNYITNKLAIQTIGGLKAEQYQSAAEDIGDRCYWVDDENPVRYESSLLLKEMVEKIKANGWMSYHKVDDLLVSITVIAQCQAIYLSCQEDPEEEEKEEEKKEADQAAAE